MTSRRRRYELIIQQLTSSGVTRTDPVRSVRIALLTLESLEILDQRRGVNQPVAYYDMDLLLNDSPSQHYGAISPVPFTPLTPGLTPTVNRYMQYPDVKE